MLEQVRREWRDDFDRKRRLAIVLAAVYAAVMGTLIGAAMVALSSWLGG